jgi:polysaccharide export outer membrane protein
MRVTLTVFTVVCGLGIAAVAPAYAQRSAAAAPAATPALATPPPVAGVPVPDGYVIGPEDVLAVQFWRDDQISGDAVVRPDGKITLRLLNDVDAAGLTPEQLRERLMQAASKFLEDPQATVAVKSINSRKVYITGEIIKSGPFAINSPMTVLQLITMAGGLTEYAKRDKILVHRLESGRPIVLKFDYEAVLEGKKLEQNILLRPNDQVTVP